MKPTTCKSRPFLSNQRQCTSNTFFSKITRPDAYKGKSAYMEDIMDFLITRTDEWYTSRVCPWRMTDQINVSWNIWRFNKYVFPFPVSLARCTH